MIRLMIDHLWRAMEDIQDISNDPNLPEWFHRKLMDAAVTIKHASSAIMERYEKIEECPQLQECDRYDEIMKMIEASKIMYLGAVSVPREKTLWPKWEPKITPLDESLFKNEVCGLPIKHRED